MAGGNDNFSTADVVTLHATTVVVDDRAALIVGAAGRGKSSLALQLMAFGAQLVSDDRTQVTREGGDLWASAPPAISGLIEARGLGLLKAAPVARARLCVVIDMDQVAQDRLPEGHQRVIAGISLPCLHKTNSSAFPAAVLQYLKMGIRDPS